MKRKDVHGVQLRRVLGDHGLDLWQHHDHGKMAVEISGARSTSRAGTSPAGGLSHEAHQRDPQRFLANFRPGWDLRPERHPW